MNPAQSLERGPSPPWATPVRAAGDARDSGEVRAAFDAKAQDWDVYSRTPLGRLRQELTLHYLGRHLETRSTPLAILDAGAGTGSYALSLAVQGHRVCLLDFSAQMLAIARRNAQERDPALLERLDFCHGSAQEVSSLFGANHFDLVLCHTLLEYVPAPRDILQALCFALKPGGLLSLLAVNPHSDALRWALSKGDLQEARQALGQMRSSTTLFGLSRRVLTGQEMREILAQLGMESVATYGVRIFADYVAAERLADPAFLSQLWELERAAGLLSPYAQIARYNLSITQKPEGS